MSLQSTILIVYTTKYRLGGHQFPVVANTLADEKRAAGFEGEIVARAVESKRDVLHAIDEIKQAGRKISEFHFVGHSGMYGPMFGTVAFPEQFSPYEWEQMEIPFAENASAYFFCCRSARWFAPFFARTFNVTAYGFFWYTTFSRSKEKYVSAGDKADGKLYTIGCKGRKSHGFTASAQKRLGFMPAEEMKRFEPRPPDGDTSYDHVAELYDAAFVDIRVRKDEWRWLNEHLPAGKLKMLDIGCGNGALLNALADRVESGTGVDESAGIIERAKLKNADHDHLSFQKINGPVLPFPDASFDVVTSLMSFRYLDWDPLLAEIKRVTKPGGKFLIIDMVTVPVAIGEYPRLLKDKLRTMKDQKSNAAFNAALHKLVSHPDWKKMLEYNPIRSEHEMKWYLESRFAGQKMETLNMAWNSRIVAFDSGPVEKGIEVKLSYP
ncbi:MAG: class I SAM-dependent methyltransferase [Pyrinomonadaceae bacterium]|nr:class I SAM-dependent methyltransferase [Pyrinomonadaceae bacterium]MBP6213053.1 class I SAM-dependent methyltransferase [Pyrinomonadaceae bacterium]